MTFSRKDANNSHRTARRSSQKPLTQPEWAYTPTFSLSQMNNVELARTLSWRENALFEEREKNVFVKPNEQCRACSDIAMARKERALD